MTQVGLDGRGLPRNASEASAHYRRACEGGVGQACFNFAQVAGCTRRRCSALPGAALCLVLSLACCLPACLAVHTSPTKGCQRGAVWGANERHRASAHGRMGVGAHALRGADRRVAVCVACLGGGQMLDQAKVPGERAAEADAHVQRRVAKFFGLACANGVAKGCVNLGVMQVRCAGLGASPLACLHPRGSPLVCPWHVAWRAQASDALWQG